VEALSLLKETFADFQRHKGQWLSAAIAYFTMLSIAPLIIVIVEIAGAFLGQHRAALDQLYQYLRAGAGESAELGIRSIVVSTFDRKSAGLLAQIISWGVFVFAAIGLFTALQSAFDTIWDVDAPKQPWWQALRSRIIAISVVLAIALLLVVLLAVNAVLNTSSIFPFGLHVLDVAVSIVLTTAAFCLLFAYLPQAPVDWRSVAIGATITAMLFVIGQTLLGWYLGRTALSSTYGAFGGLIAFLIWVNYSAQILFLGAEFTHVLERRARTVAQTVTSKY